MSLGDLATAWDVIKCSGCSNVGLVLDTWHFSRGAGSLAMLRSLPGTAFRTVQISDGQLAGPPGIDYLQDTLSNRLPPGSGEFDLLGIIQALSQIGADVAWDMEICSSVLDGLPGPEAALRAANATRAVLAEGGWRSTVARQLPRQAS
jgi:sugar phosphate isomerase/epimerase